MSAEGRKTRTRRDSIRAKEEMSVHALLLQINKRFDTLSTKDDLKEIRTEIKKNSKDIAEV